MGFLKENENIEWNPVEDMTYWEFTITFFEVALYFLKWGTSSEKYKEGLWSFIIYLFM